MMDIMKLRENVEKANDRVMAINKASKAVEDIANKLASVKDGKAVISIQDKSLMTIRLDDILDEEKMQNIYEYTMTHLEYEAEKRIRELEFLTGSNKSISVSELSNETTESVKSTSDICSHEMTVENVKKLYVDEQASLDYIAEYFNLEKAVVKKFITTNKILRSGK